MSDGANCLRILLKYLTPTATSRHWHDALIIYDRSWVKDVNSERYRSTMQTIETRSFLARFYMCTGNVVAHHTHLRDMRMSNVPPKYARVGHVIHLPPNRNENDCIRNAIRHRLYHWEMDESTVDNYRIYRKREARYAMLSSL